MSRIFYSPPNNQVIILSYAGGTKYFTPLANELGFQTFKSNIVPTQVLQIVREPIQRWMSWFDKQYLKNLFRTTGLSNKRFGDWCERTVTRKFLDRYFKDAYYKIHYDGHTQYQCHWPRVVLKDYLHCNWQYLEMENINPYFLQSKPYRPKHDKSEYLGLWKKMNFELKEYALYQARELYNADIEWYNNLDFISLSKKG